MATTEEVLTILEDMFKNSPRDGVRGLRTYLDIVQRMLYQIEADQLIIYDSTTGRIPLFTTIEGTFDYTLPNNINFIGNILVEKDTWHNLPMNLGTQDYGRSLRKHQTANQYIILSGIEHLRIPYCRTYPYNESSSARVLFTEDPGNTTNVYRYLGYELPTPILSDNIQMSIHPPYDIEILLPATKDYIEAIAHGNLVDFHIKLNQVYKPQMIQAFNMGEQGVDYSSEDRGF